MEVLQDLPGVGISTGRMAKSATWSPTDYSGSTAKAAGGWGARSYRLEQGAEEKPYHMPKSAWAFL